MNPLSLEYAPALPRSCTAPGTCTATPPALRRRLPDDHVLAVLMDEHQRLLARLHRLLEIAGLDLASLGLARRASLLEEVLCIASALLGAEPHHRREELVLFPALGVHGITGPPSVMVAEHRRLRAREQRLEIGTLHALRTGGQGWTDLMLTARALARDLEGHIHEEDEVLYPLAFRTIPDPAEWATMARACEEIGACCHAGG